MNENNTLVPSTKDTGVPEVTLPSTGSTQRTTIEHTVHGQKFYAPRMPPTPRTNLRASFSQFFWRAHPQRAFKKFSGTPRFVYCQNFIPVRRLQLDKTPKNGTQKIEKWRTLNGRLPPKCFLMFHYKI